MNNTILSIDFTEKNNIITIFPKESPESNVVLSAINKKVLCLENTHLSLDMLPFFDVCDFYTKFLKTYIHNELVDKGIL